MKIKNFYGSILMTIICLALSFYWGSTHPMGVYAAVSTTAVLAIMEVSLSLDNAIFNATKLKDLSPAWQKVFLTVGILVAVFGMRLFFPIEIVSKTTGQSFMEVLDLALHQPAEYSRLLTSHHAEIAFFGGAFLIMIFFGFLFDEEKEAHWLGGIERFFGEKLGKAGAPLSAMLALMIVYIVSRYIPNAEESVSCLSAGVIGVALNLAVQAFEAIFEDEETGENPVAPLVKAGMAGFAGFVYLEILDASFSFDGVIGAFAITNDIIIIMLGLAIGAMFVRSMTVSLVEAGTLGEFIYLEHGASYAIGGLAVIMFVTTFVDVPEWVPGLLGVALIGLSFISSVIYNKRNPDVEDA